MHGARRLVPFIRLLGQSLDPALLSCGADSRRFRQLHRLPHGPGGGSSPVASAPDPFGTIYSTNITPDPETGIGRWSEAAFLRVHARRRRPRGRHLYPAFPYDHYTLVTDGDNQALYAYLMTRQPVSPRRRRTSCRSPSTSACCSRAGNSCLYGRAAPARSGLRSGTAGATWPRARAIAAPAIRRATGWAREKGRAFRWQPRRRAGTPTPIDENSPAPISWKAESLSFYLRRGWHEHHGVSRGPMRR